MTKIAFMFPGQGSYEAGMGREIAEAVPEAMAVYDAGSEAAGSGLGLAIIKAIAERHGATLALGESERLGGLSATVCFQQPA